MRIEKVILKGLKEDVDITSQVLNLKTETVTVGKVSDQLLKDFADHAKHKLLAKTEGEIEVLTYRKQRILGQITDQEVEKMQQELDKRADALSEKYTKESRTLWNRVYEELKIEDKDLNYTINRKTGVVTTEIETSEGLKQ